MSDFSTKERLCSNIFSTLGECHHLWTLENFEIIFTCKEDYMAGMTIIGICAKLFPDIKILTFELMSNHLHIAASGKVERIMALFNAVKEMLRKHFRNSGRTIHWDGFIAKSRHLTTLKDARNVIAYDNRNGFVVHPEHTPFTYPWGANRFYFNPDAICLAAHLCKPINIREKRQFSHSRIADRIEGLQMYDGYALPTSFCAIEEGKKLFRDASHYFSQLSKAIETSKDIANEIGESIYYTDDDLFYAICKISREKYSEPILTHLKAQDKISLAKTMRFDYHADADKIHRMLDLDYSIISALGF